MNARLPKNIENTVTPTVTLSDIELAAKNLAAARDVLKEIAAEMQSEVDAVKHRYRKALLKSIEAVKAATAEQMALVEAAPALFVKPRSVQFHGIKCGYREDNGTLSFGPGMEHVIARLRKFAPEDAERMIAVKESIPSAVVRQLPAALQAKIGVTIEGAGDKPFVKFADTELDKMLAVLLSDIEDDAQKAAA